MRQVAIIFVTTVLSGLVLIALILFIAPPVLGPVLLAIARLPSPFGEIAWVAVLFPLGVMGLRFYGLGPTGSSPGSANTCSNVKEVHVRINIDAKR